MEKRVAIIGAGISGLLACKYAISKGFSPIVFEAQDQVGGLWNHTIECTRLQNDRETFQFSDYPWPSSVKNLYPTNTQLLEYLKSYAQHFQLLPYINFNCQVTSIDYVGASEEEMQSWDLWGGVGKAFGSKGKWNLRVRHTKEDSTKDYEAEFVILCIGRFSGLPNIPEFPLGYGPEVFSGNVLHSMDYAAMDNSKAAEFIKGKRIAIVGSGKSAFDLAYECAGANGTDNPCTIVQRTVHWSLPDPHLWGVSYGFFCFARCLEFMVRKPGEGFLSSALATMLSPLRWATSKFAESYLKWRLPLKKYDMVPKESYILEASSCQIFFLLDNFYDKVEEGSIALKQSQQFRFCKEGLILDGEVDPLKVDIVIFATGYKGDEKLRNMFSEPKFQKCIVGSPTSTIPLYRQMIHPRVPQLAVIGYSESLANLYTFEVRCKWLAFFLDQTFQLPSIDKMEENVKMWDEYMKRDSGNGKFRRSCVGSVQVWYNDQLCKDIGSNPRRKKGFFSEVFESYGTADYKDLAPGF